MTDKKPKISKYLEDIFQEFPPAQDDQNAGWENNWKRDWTNDWNTDWQAEWGNDWRVDWRTDWRREWPRDEWAAPVSRSQATDVRSTKLRAESFGGLVYDPKNRTVFSVNKLGYEIISLLQENASVIKIAEKLNLTPEAIIEFLNALGNCNIRVPKDQNYPPLDKEK